MGLFRRRMQDSTSNSATYIGSAAVFRGQFTGKGAFVFCGDIEGDCDIDGPVTLAAGARWLGTLKAKDVIIAGTVDGDVIAGARVEIAGSAKITGSLTGRSIAIAEGAVIEGELKVTSGGETLHFEEKREFEATQTANAA
jgi:cytoskeletal protein CcmA (bactofilin family)